MKRFSIMSLLIAILATSCQTSSELGSNALIQKRRYTKGYNLNIKKPLITKDSERQSETNNPVLAESRNTNLLDDRNHPIPELKTKEVTERKLASEELSKSLLNRKEEVEKDEIKLNVAPPKSVDDAFPLVMKNRRSNTTGNAIPAAAVSDEEMLLIIILTILLPPLGVGLVFGISKEFWISLLLTIIFYFPGLIYSLIVILKS